ncbi:DeoR/GlpR family DNA-binding transcription regulator [Kiloniella sp. GXU_MW_B19]|uniref:DeoR/GlpR family DNA-binding transcription regulator n=1 Tax=Kiloniella sp. GXU_MW_B19 TaxID=3141326 RepID=UPI003FA14591
MSRRQEDILKLAQEQGFVSIEQLAQDFGVTTQTIRRDINALCDGKLLDRFHGGASFRSSVKNLDFGQRQSINSEEKQGIARLVADLIPDHASVFMYMGTTSERVARALLRHEGLRIITNSLAVAHVMSENPSFEVIVSGGVVRSQDRGILGEATMDFFRQFRADYGVIGCGGLDEDGAILDYDYSSVRSAQVIMENARTTILAADSSKFGRTALVRMGHLSQIQVLATDRMPKGDLGKCIKGLDLELKTVSEISG